MPQNLAKSTEIGGNSSHLPVDSAFLISEPLIYNFNFEFRISRTKALESPN